MGIVDRAVDDEPEEKPDQLGRHLLRIKRDHPGEWREAFESTNRSHAVRIEGCLIGRGEGRIAGVTDIAGWEARMIERHEAVDGKDVLMHVIRVRYTPPKAKAKDHPVETIDRTAPTGAVPPTAGAPAPPPRDPDESAQAGLDLAAG